MSNIRIQASVRRTGFALVAIALIIVLTLYYFGEWREESKNLLVIFGLAGAAASLFFKARLQD
ncbi:MAG TPA: hypothetical protein VN655_05920 [Pseudolabrys sp.]|jgi:hypothetical protein|nr:hypothetical protein [Pseudolabrys sp.]